MLILSKKWQKSSSRLSYLKKLYDNRKWKKSFADLHMKKVPPYTIINGLPIHFDPKWKRIGISFSGGADSSLLLFLLCKLIQDKRSSCKIYPIHLIRFHDQKPWLEYMAKDVYNWIDNKYPNILQEMQWGFIPPFLEQVKLKNLQRPELDLKHDADLVNCDVVVVGSFLEYQSSKYNLDYIYTGNTTNPPIDHKNAPAFRQKDVVADNLDKVVNIEYINPFALINKAWIMSQYKNFDLFDSLLPLTRSCEQRMPGYKMDSWKFGDEYPQPCEKCFFCKEREWGLQYPQMQEFLEINNNNSFLNWKEIFPKMKDIFDDRK